MRTITAILAGLLLTCQPKDTIRIEPDSSYFMSGKDILQSELIMDVSTDITLPTDITLLNGNNEIFITADSIYWNGRPITGDTALVNALRKFLFP